MVVSQDKEVMGDELAAHTVPVHGLELSHRLHRRHFVPDQPRRFPKLRWCQPAVDIPVTCMAVSSRAEPRPLPCQGGVQACSWTSSLSPVNIFKLVPELIEVHQVVQQALELPPLDLKVKGRWLWTQYHQKHTQHYGTT